MVHSSAFLCCQVYFLLSTLSTQFGSSAMSTLVLLSETDSKPGLSTDTLGDTSEQLWAGGVTDCKEEARWPQRPQLRCPQRPQLRWPQRPQLRWPHLRWPPAQVSRTQVTPADTLIVYVRAIFGILTQINTRLSADPLNYYVIINIISWHTTRMLIQPMSFSNLNFNSSWPLSFHVINSIQTKCRRRARIQ